MRRAAVALAAVLLLAGCASAHGPTPTGPAGEAQRPCTLSVWVQTVDGRRVPCVWAKEGQGGGLSCDWGAK